MNMEIAGEEIVEQPLVVMMRDDSREVVQVVVDEDAKAIISYENPDRTSQHESIIVRISRAQIAAITPSICRL